MAFIIAEPCINVKGHGLCGGLSGGLHPSSKRQARLPVREMLCIDPDECIDCGACEPACPVQAIFPEDMLPEHWKQFVEINARYYQHTASGA